MAASARKVGVFSGPKCLIDTNTATGKMEIQEAVLDEIMAIEQQLNVVAITGLYRTGKSYLLTRLAGEYKGFPLGSTVQSKTKGIWVWCRKHPVHKDQILLLLDSEGLGDVEKGDSDHDNKLFALITLLCSTLIYNMLGVFNQEALDKLNFITEISKHIKTKESSSDDQDLDRYFPELILALRDHTLEMVIDGIRVNADEYFEYCLKLEEGSDEITVRKNKPRLCIRKYFSKRHCFTFERPGDAKTLKTLDTLNDKKLHKQFVNDTKKFLYYVWNSCKPMTAPNGKPITGCNFGHLLKSYVKAVNDGGVPCIESTLTTMAEIENKKAVKLAVEKYTQLMAEKAVLPVADDSKLGSFHDECSKAAMDVYAEKSMFDESREYFNTVNNLIWDQFEVIKKENDNISETRCTVLLEKLHESIKTNVEKGKYAVSGGAKLYKQDFKKLKENYRNSKEKLGPKKDDVLRRFKDKTRGEGEAILQADQKVTAAEKEKKLEEEQKEAAQRQVQSVEEENKKILQKIHEFEAQMKKSVIMVKEKHKAEMETMKENNEKITAMRIEETSRLLKENQKIEAEKTERAIQQMKQENEQLVESYQQRIANINETSKQAMEKLEKLRREENERSERWKEEIEKAQHEKEQLLQMTKRLEEERFKRQEEEKIQRETIAKQQESEDSSYGATEAAGDIADFTSAGASVGSALGSLAGPAGTALGTAVGGGIGFVVGGFKALFSL